MISMSVGAAGSSAAKSRLEKLKKKASKEQLVKAFQAGGEVLKEALEERTPVRHDSPSGTALAPGALKADIHITSGEDDHGDPAVSVGFGPVTQHVAHWVNDGHNEVAGGYRKEDAETGEARGPGHAVKFVPGTHFITQAWESAQRDAIEAVIDTLKKETGD